MVENIVYTIEDKPTFRSKVKRKWEKAKQGIRENKELIIPLVTALVGASVAIGKGVSRNHRIRKQRELKEDYYWDDQLRHHWTLKRRLSNDEMRYIDRERANGRRLSSILDELKVLK